MSLKDKQQTIQLEDTDLLMRGFIYEDVKEAVLSLKLLYQAHDMEEAVKMLETIFGDFEK